MAVRPGGAALREIRTLFAIGSPGGLTDGELLGRYADGGAGAEAAFAALVDRHGPMVLRVCGAVLRDGHDAEDAFQATFLVLARKAAKLPARDTIGPWLHQVALRVASCARADRSRRRRHERRRAEDAGPGLDGPAAIDDGLGAMLHEEIARLKERYGAPVVLCDLQGRTYAEAAGRLGLPIGTVKSRLARGRRLLRDRLERRGVTPAIGPPAALASGGIAPSVPAALAGRAVGSAVATSLGGAIPGSVAALTINTLRSMTMMNATRAGLLLAVAASIGAGLGVIRGLAGDDRPSTPTSAEPVSPAPAPRDLDEIRRELRGTWTAWTTVEPWVGGRPQPPRRVRYAWVIDGDRIIETRAGDIETLEFEQEYTYALDPAGPGTIDLHDPARGASYESIYRLEGDRLTICMGIDDRPAAFEGHPDRGPILREFERAGREPAEVAERFERAPGGHWVLDPGNWSSAMTEGVSILTEREADGSMSLVIAHPVRDRKAPSPDYRPVLFDAERGRHLPERGTGGWSQDRASGAAIALYRYRMDPEVLPAEEVEHIGVEVLSAEARRIERDEARERAEAAGIVPLPGPEVGAPFPFSLPALDGGRIDSEGLRGKVVLIDCWATWCGPCMAKMPELKATYERYRDDGFEVVGINFDSDLDDAERAISELGLDWPHARIADDERRDLWSEASGIAGVPRLFLIDRRGLLSAEEVPTGPGLDALIGRLLADNPR